MSESLNFLPLILGIIGTATGASAIVFSYLNYVYQKPNLDVKVTSFFHNYQKSEMFPPDMEILFFPILEIKNKGDRGTTISKIELSLLMTERNTSHIIQPMEKNLKLPMVGVKRLSRLNLDG